MSQYREYKYKKTEGMRGSERQDGGGRHLELLLPLLTAPVVYTIVRQSVSLCVSLCSLCNFLYQTQNPKS